MIKGIEILWKEVGKDLEQGQLSTITTVWSQRKIPEAFPTKNQTGWSLHQQHKWEWLCTIQSHTTQCHPDPRASIADLQQWASALSSPAAKQLVTTSSSCRLMKELCQTLNTSWPPFSPKQREATCTCFGTNTSDVLHHPTDSMEKWAYLFRALV